jgi:hypothetical protein
MTKKHKEAEESPTPPEESKKSENIRNEDDYEDATMTCMQNKNDAGWELIQVTYRKKKKNR